MNQRDCMKPSILILITLVCLALMPRAHAVSPPPDGGYPGGNAVGGTATTVITNAAPIIASQLINISTRAFVQTGDNVIIGGFIVQGIGPKKLIVRAIGPELIPHGVPNVLADPTLELHDA